MKVRNMTLEKAEKMFDRANYILRDDKTVCEKTFAVMAALSQGAILGTYDRDSFKDGARAALGLSKNPADELFLELFIRRYQIAENIYEFHRVER